MSDSVQLHRRQPTRLRSPWDSPGKNTGVGCHFLLQCMKVKSESEVAQLCLTLSDPMDWSLPGSSIHGISRQEYWSGVPLPSPILTWAHAKLYKSSFFFFFEMKVTLSLYPPLCNLLCPNFNPHYYHFAVLQCLEPCGTVS